MIEPDASGGADPALDLPPEPRRHERRLIGLAVLFGLIVVAGGAWILTGRLLDGAGEGFGAGLRRRWLDQQSQLLAAPKSGDQAPQRFEVAEGELLVSVADRLQARGLIRDAGAFRLLARVRGLDTRIQAGDHALSADMDAETLLQALLSASGASVTVALPEGKRVEEVLDLLSASGLGTLAELEAARAALRPSDVPPGLDWIPAGAGGGLLLEGFLFPDTYQLDPTAAPTVSLRRLLENFAARWPKDGAIRAAAVGLSPYEALTLASIVEREAVLAAERPRIARVFLNRLSEAPFILNADPTIQYALGYQADAGTWWRRPLLTTDLQVDSPYNSYTRGGLPPSPICSPGLASIEAVLSPDDGPWRYFVADDRACDGSHVFAETLEQHVANIAAYQTGDCGG